MTFAAYTGPGQIVHIESIEHNGNIYLFTVKNGKIYQIDQYAIVFGDKRIPLFTDTGKPIRSVDDLVTSEEPLFFKPLSVIKVTTSDPIGTKRFDDAYRISMTELKIEDLTIKLLEVLVAVVHNSVPSTSPGFKVGIEQKAYLFKYSYLIRHSDSHDIISRTLNIGIGNVLATENQFFSTKHKNGMMLPKKSTPLLDDLARVIRMIQPGSRFGNYELSVMFWTKCVSNNIKEIYSLANIRYDPNAKFTATLRDGNAKQNLAELNLILMNVPLMTLKF